MTAPWLLGALRRAGLHATVFDIAQRDAEYRQLAHQTVAYGNALKDHTWDHRSLTGAPARAPALTARQVIAELDRAKRAIVSATGWRPQFVRPPYGDASAAVQRLARVFGLIQVGWTVRLHRHLQPAARRCPSGATRRCRDHARCRPHAHHPRGHPGDRGRPSARGFCAGQLVPSGSGISWVGARHVPRGAGGLVISALESTG
jgi:peptidoglycan/xylan/chitin deacetylase (PgdA/CDA1 family)